MFYHIITWMGEKYNSQEVEVLIADTIYTLVQGKSEVF